MSVASFAAELQAIVVMLRRRAGLAPCARLVCAAACALALLHAPGCRAAAGKADANRVVADTGGYSLRILMKRPKEQRYELYEVNRQGRAGFSGGAEALTDRLPEFMTDLPPQVAERFRAEIASCPWTESKPEDRGAEGLEPITVVTLGLPNGFDRRFTLHGPQPQVDVFVKLIEPVVRKRHDPYLDRLPEATEVPKVKDFESSMPAAGSAQRGGSGGASSPVMNEPKGS